MNPNSQHQLWSRWTLTIVRSGKHPPLREVEANFAQWLKRFGSACRGRMVRELWRDVFTLDVEGVPAHDPSYVSHVTLGWKKFCDAGYGTWASSAVSVKVLAGNQQDGRPRPQWVELPAIRPLQ